MEKRELYDVIIVGGGPAGLSVGSELSKELKVLIIEQGEVGKTTKSWFVPKDVVEKNEDIIQFTYSGVQRFLCDTFSGSPLDWESRLFDRYPYIKENEILNYWKELIMGNGSDILEECLYEDHLVERDRVKVETLKGIYEGKMLIDASGSDSTILKKYEVDIDDYYWWSVYGCIGNHPDGVKNMKVGDYMLWQTFKDTNADLNASLREGRPVFEYEILNENTSFPLILFLRKEKMPLDFMRAQFEHIIRNEESTKEFHDIDIVEYKYGWYPSGGLNQRIARERVAFVGDAACWSTPCGWGMGFILNNYKQYATSLIKLVQEDRLDEKSIKTLVAMDDYDKTQILVNQIITHFLSNATAKQLDKFIEIFRTIDPLICETIFTLKVTKEELKTFIEIALRSFDVDELIRIFPKEDYLKLIKLARISGTSLIKEVVRKIFKRHRSDQDHGGGFDITPQ